MDNLILANYTEKVWENLCEMYPALVHFDPPKIKLCGRLSKTAGKCWQEERIIHIGKKFYLKTENTAYMNKQIVPHEIIHQADFDLFGVSEKKDGHGKKWVQIMVKYGLPPDKYHSLTI